MPVVQCIIQVHRSVDIMAAKGHYIYNTLAVSITIIILGYILKKPLLPIRNETKRSLGYPKDSLLNFTELSAKYGYLSEEHRAVTKDGYVLTMFRVVKGRNCRREQRSTPVLLMHGLLQSSDSWIDSGPNAGLAYLISDACHDLWVGNTRGNYYSRAHTTLNPDQDPQYWKFCVDEIGRYDVPAMIDYVLQYTGLEKLNYIGFSQGAGTYFIMCSEMPEYCDKVNVVIALAPATRQTYTKSLPYRVLTRTMTKIEGILTRTGVQEVFSKGALSQEFLAFFCQFSTITEMMCESGRNLIDSYHPGSVSNETTRALFGHFPAGTSVHNMARYGQSMDTENFQKFDYGREGNIQLYGSADPPKYNLSAVTVPVVTIYGKNDRLVDVKDVKWLLGQLPNVLEEVLVSDPLWNHLDVTYSQHTGELLFPKINEYLIKYSVV